MGGKRSLGSVKQAVDKEPKFGGCNHHTHADCDPEPARVLRSSEVVTSENKREHSCPKGLGCDQGWSDKQAESAYLVEPESKACSRKREQGGKAEPQFLCSRK